MMAKCRQAKIFNYSLLVIDILFVAAHHPPHHCYPSATHLLQAGVDINTIRAWLGHVSVETTNIYAEVNLEMKAKALLNS